MKKLLIISVGMMFLTMISCQQQPKFTYPVTAKVDQTDDYFGTTVTDPYRWLEDDNSAETAEWVKAQNAVTFGYLEQIPYRQKIQDRLTKIWDYPKVTAPYKEGGRFYYSKNNGLQNQFVVFSKDALDGEERMVLDPNTFSEDGTVSLSTFSPSDDGKYIGYGISRGGSDWSEYFVMNAGDLTKLDDHLKWIKFSGISWYGDGFFYSRYPEPAKGDELKGMNENSKVYYHKVGDPQEKDELVYEDPAHPNWGFSAYATEDKEVLILTTNESTKGNKLAFRRMADKNKAFTSLVDYFQYDYYPIQHIKGVLYVMTDEGAPKYRLIAIDLNNPAKENWKVVIPEKEEVLTSISMVGNKIVATYMKDAHDVVQFFDVEGNYLYDLEMPILGSIGGFSGKMTDTFTFYTVTSFTTPATIFKYDLENNVSEEYNRSAIDFDPNLYETRQVFYTSKDGTKVPMFIVHKKGIKLDGNNPALLYGYGGFNVSLTPSFSMSRLILLENGFVFAMANLRGGGEYGEEWHQGGTKMNKQNVFDDFIAAAEYLVANKYTSPKRLAIQGGSNGGLLVGAVINQRPDLFGVALPAVGVMDMLRYHKFTIGKYWAVDYGTSEDSKEMFDYLRKYSPLHSIRNDVEYPAVLVTTADHDDRVVPAHSFKYIATLQENYLGRNPVMIRIETKAGHGGGKPTAMIIEEYADLWAFVMKNLGVTPKY
ncbi:MAG TPA: prolyl oligopeptidase family serine peptidase [Bacteroidales bacterium]|nr:prolyl oligopeptidase family serine peptidase [Bacteroidales bacterium]HPI86616.1 prolyl oligopeptidase family serine peptidase [Bacteroidales bacterium]HPM93167.1 prolyl oligopeptidase family serine peptidase [Bacteroidales bacterium]